MVVVLFILLYIDSGGFSVLKLHCFEIKNMLVCGCGSLVAGAFADVGVGLSVTDHSAIRHAPVDISCTSSRMFLFFVYFPIFPDRLAVLFFHRCFQHGRLSDHADALDRLTECCPCLDAGVRAAVCHQQGGADLAYVAKLQSCEHLGDATYKKREQARLAEVAAHIRRNDL